MKKDQTHTASAKADAVAVACCWVLERVVLGVPGVSCVSVDPVGKVVRFKIGDTPAHAGCVLRGADAEFAGSESSADHALKEVLARLSAHRYEPLPLSLASGHAAASDRQGGHQRLMRLAVAGFCFGNVMLYASATYLGEYTGGLSATYEVLFRYLSAALTLPALVYSAQPFWKGFLNDIRRRSVGLDTPVVLALVIGTAYSTASLFGTAGGHLYFDTITGLVFTVLVARFINERILEQAHEAAGSLSRLLPESSRWVKPGDLVSVRKGERVPADGVLTSTETVELNEAALTGEFAPVTKGFGEHVFAGTQNMGDPFEMKVSFTAEDSRLGKIQELLAIARSQKGRFSTLSARMVRYFVTLQILVALVNAAVRIAMDAGHVLETTTAILVIGCPCALAFGVPLATALSLRRLWQEKIFARSESIFDAALHVSDVVLDKTGTLTSGVFAVESVHERAPIDSETRLALWLATGQSVHPVSRAVNRWLAVSADSRSLVASVVPVSGAREEPAGQWLGLLGDEQLGASLAIKEISGSGLIAIGSSGEFLRVGNVGFCEQASFLRPGELRDWISSQPAYPAGQTPVCAVSASGYMGRFGLSDSERAGAVLFLDWARSRSLRLHLLSGDTPESVQVLAARFEAEYTAPSRWQKEPLFTTLKGAQTPEDKLRFVEQLKQNGSVVMMLGDGINDAAALARADVAVAAHGGVDLAQSHSDVAFHGPDLSALVTFFDRASYCVRAQKRVLLISLFYNVCALALASAGFVHPVWAAFLMPASSVSVLFAAGFWASGQRFEIQRRASPWPLGNENLNGAVPDGG